MLSDKLLSSSLHFPTSIGPDLFVWGNNSSGYLGLSDAVTRSSPVQLTGTWLQASFSDYNSTFLRPDGTLWTSGYNSNGSIGDGTIVNRSSPTQVAGTWLMSHSGSMCQFALRSDNSLWSWGHGYKGILGLGITIKRSSPAQVAGTWKWAFQGKYNSLGLKSDNSLWSWGDNSYGILGVNDGTSGAARSSPVQISGTWFKATSGGVSGTSTASAGIKSDGSLWTWGKASYGALGVGDTAGGNQSSPVQVAGTWRDVVAGGRGQIGFLALRHNGTIWSWGRTNYGGLGFSSPAGNQSSPVQIGTGTWVSIAGSLNSRMAFSATGELWSWGKNNNGQLGVGDTVNRSSPVQVSGTWKDSGNGFVAGIGRGFKI